MFDGRVARLQMEYVMRTVVVVLAAFAAVFASTGGARAETVYPWCAQYFDEMGSSNCGFESFEQCQLTVRGAGGMCARNLWYREPVAEPAPAPALPPPSAPRKNPPRR
jgi:hypothetical protein